jgi:hypothetical protein
MQAVGQENRATSEKLQAHLNQKGIVDGFQHHSDLLRSRETCS